MPRIVDKREKSEAIARAAMGVFREQGYHGTRMADIARTAGMGKGTIYEYFRNKAEILRFAFDRYFESFKAGAVEAMRRVRDPADKLFALVEFALEHASEWEDHCVVYVDYLGVERAADESVSLGRIYGEMRDLLASLIAQAQSVGTIRRDVDPGITAEVLLSVYDGIVLHRIFEEHRCDRGAMGSAALAILKQGLRPPGPSF